MIMIIGDIFIIKIPICICLLYVNVNDNQNETDNKRALLWRVGAVEELHRIRASSKLEAYHV